MANDLDEVRDRLNWVEGEIATVAKEAWEWGGKGFRRYIEPAPHRPGYRLLLADQISELPFGIKARSGTSVNEMRSCLDALVGVLATRNNRSKAGTYFPITDSEEEFLDKRKGQEKIRKISAKDAEKIAEFRPFLRAIDGESGNELLWSLHKSDIKRKHQELVPQTSHTAWGVYGNGHVGEVIGLSPKIKKSRMEVALVSNDTTVDIRWRPFIAYSEPAPIANRPVNEVLSEFLVMTRKIVAHFD